MGPIMLDLHYKNLAAAWNELHMTEIEDFKYTSASFYSVRLALNFTKIA